MGALYVILMIGGLVLIHELGHYLLARAVGVHVVEFAIGVGPKILTIKGKQKRPDLPPTLYTIGLLPFGGFVRMLGTDPHEVVPEEIEAVSFNAKRVWQRFLVMIAGPAFNILLALGIYFGSGLFTSQLLPSQVGVVDSNRPAYAAGLRAGDRIVEVNGEPIEYFWQISSKVASSYEVREDANGKAQVVGLPVDLAWERGGERFSAKVDTLGLREELIPASPGLWVRERALLGVTADSVSPIIAVEPDSLAAKAGLKTWDRIIALDGKRVDRLSEVWDALNAGKQRPVSVEVLRYVEAQTDAVLWGLGQQYKVQLPPSPEFANRGLSSAECTIYRVLPDSPAAALGLLPGDTLLSFNGQTCGSWRFFDQHMQQAGLEGGTLTWRRNGVESQGPLKLGVFEWPNELKRDAVIGAHGIQVLAQDMPGALVPNEARLSYALYEMTSQISQATGSVISSMVALFSGRVAVKDSLGGPVLMGQLASKTSEFGWGYFFTLMAGFSVSLALLNMLPIPVLDGGQILFLAIEGIRRKPVSMRVRMIATYAGMAFIVMLMVVVFRYDLERCWG